MALSSKKNILKNTETSVASDPGPLRMSYYKKIREQVERIEGKPSKELKNYTQSYEDELNRCQYKETSATAFFKAADTSQVLLVGDFHAQPQSTRSLLRICRRLGHQKVVLILECFRQSDQKHIDAFLKGDLSEQEFLKVINWSSSWNFPWGHTRALMKWAISHHVPVYGMNLEAKKITLKKRDQHFAKVIHHISQKTSKTLVVQVGDFHLSQKHLPLEIRKMNKKLRVQSVYQSPDQLYFKVIKKNKSEKSNLNKISDFLDLKDNRWALMTLVPWVKWQEYLLYLESGSDRSVDSEDFDITDHVDRFINLVSQTLQIKIDSQDLSVYSSHDPQVLKAVNKLDQNLRRKIKNDISQGQSFFIPELKMGVISRLTVNHISRVSAQFILYKMQVFTQTILESKAHFLKLIWIEMLMYFISKITNPKRKTDTLSDIRKALNSAAFEDKGKEALSLALEQKMKEIQYMNTHRIVLGASRRRIKSQSYVTASGIIGGILGEKIFFAFHKKILKFPAAQSFLFKHTNQKTFDVSYYEAIEVIDSWPLPFKSKYDQF